MLIKEGHFSIDQTLHDFLMHVSIDTHKNEAADKLSENGYSKGGAHDDYQHLVEGPTRSSIAALQSDTQVKTE